MQNLRPLKLNLDGKSPDIVQSWLHNQTDDVRRVTYIENGEVYQKPYVEEGAYVDPTAQVLGGVIIKKGCYVGPNAVIRLDEKPSPEPLIIGEYTNIQDCAVVHSTSQSIGRRVIVAHQAIVHGATVEDAVTIYIQSVVDGGGTVIGKGSFLHQGVYVGKGIRIAPNRYIAPGSKILTQREADKLPDVTRATRAIAEHVLELNAGHVKRYLD